MSEIGDVETEPKAQAPRDLLLDLYELLTNPACLPDLIGTVSAWLMNAPGAGQIRELEAHSDRVWRLLTERLAAMNAESREQEEEWQPFAIETVLAPDHDRLRNLASGEEMLARIAFDEATASLAMVRREGNRFVHRPLGVTMSEAMRQLFRESFSLTDAEIDVAEALAEGVSVSEIAEQRGTSRDTVRNQIKSLAGKIGADGQRAVALAYQEAARANAQARPAGSTGGKRVALGSTRHVEFYEYGPADGRPMLYLHSGVNGPLWSDDAVQRAAQLGFRVFSPARPGIGQSSPTAEHLQGIPALDQQALDIGHALERLMPNLSGLTVLSYFTGFAVAWRFAHHYHDRVRQVIGINVAVPILTAEDVAAYRGLYRGLAAAALEAPLAARLFARGAAATWMSMPTEAAMGVFDDRFKIHPSNVNAANAQLLFQDQGTFLWRDALNLTDDWVVLPKGTNRLPRVVLGCTLDSPFTSEQHDLAMSMRVGASRVAITSGSFPHITGQIEELFVA